MALNVMLYAAFPPYVELDHYFIDILSETLLAGTLIVLGGKPSKGVIYYCIYFSDTTSLHFTSLFSEHLIRTELGIKQQKKKTSLMHYV